MRFTLDGKAVRVYDGGLGRHPVHCDGEPIGTIVRTAIGNPSTYRAVRDDGEWLDVSRHIATGSRLRGGFVASGG